MSNGPPFEGAKQDTIGVIEGTNAKLPHHRGLMPTYQMENEIPFVHHVVKRRDVVVQLRTTKTKMERPKDI
jgi:hypothetical protein